MTERWTDVCPNYTMWVKRTPDGGAVFDHFDRITDMNVNYTIVRFDCEYAASAALPIHAYTPEFEVMGLRFENLGRNLYLNAIIGRLIEAENVNG